MIFMNIFWALCAVNVVLYLVLKKAYGKEKAENISFVASFLPMSFLIVAIAKNDPLFAQFGVPGEYEWVVGTAIGAFFSWKWYLNPFKERVSHLEIDMSSVKADISSIKSDIALIKEKIMTTV